MKYHADYPLLLNTRLFIAAAVLLMGLS